MRLSSNVEMLAWRATSSGSVKLEWWPENNIASEVKGSVSYNDVTNTYNLESLGGELPSGAGGGGNSVQFVRGAIHENIVFTQL